MAGDLYCKPCDVKPQLRAQQEQPDGTIVHKPCGQPLDIVQDKAKEPAKSRRKPERRHRKAKGAAAATAPETPSQLHELGPFLRELERLGARPDLQVTVSWRGNTVTAHISPMEA